MTMTVTMLTTVMGEAGTLLVKDSQYTVSDKFGAELVGLRRAIDTNRALTPPNSTQPAFLATDPLTGKATGIYDTDGEVISLGGGGGPLFSKLTKFSKGIDLSNNGVRPARILIAGDSTTAGVGTFLQQNTFAATIAKWFKAQNNCCYGAQIGSVGSVAIMDPRITLGSGWSAGSAVGTFAGGMISAASGTTAGYAIATGSNVDRIRVYFARSASGGSALVKVNGSVATTASGVLNTAGANGAKFADYVCPFTPNALISIDTVTVNTVSILGVEWYDSRNPGVIIYQCGVSNAKAGDCIGVSLWHDMAANITAIQPDLTIMDFMINDTRDSQKTLPATYLTALQAWNTSASTYGDVLFTGYAPCNDTSYGNGYADTMFAQIEAVAATTAAGVAVDWRVALGADWATANTAGYFFDNYHCNALGYSKKAKYLASLTNPSLAFP